MSRDAELSRKRQSRRVRPPACEAAGKPAGSSLDAASVRFLPSLRSAGSTKAPAASEPRIRICSMCWRRPSGRRRGSRLPTPCRPVRCSRLIPIVFVHGAPFANAGARLVALRLRLRPDLFGTPRHPAHLQEISAPWARVRDCPRAGSGGAGGFLFTHGEQRRGRRPSLERGHLLAVESLQCRGHCER
jgi:hypothetical protein